MGLKRADLRRLSRLSQRIAIKIKGYGKEEKEIKGHVVRETERFYVVNTGKYCVNFLKIDEFTGEIKVKQVS